MKHFDNTRIAGFKACPRKFYFRHVRHWETTGRKPALVFGSCWHTAMDALWQSFAESANNQLAAKAGAKAFLTAWLAEGMPDPSSTTGLADLDTLGARTPGVAYEMLLHYANTRAAWMQRNKLIAVEKPFIVPIFPDDPNTLYVGRLDKVTKDGEFYDIQEHKTTSAYKIGGPFRTNFLGSFSPNSQVDGYRYAGHMLYGEQMRRVYIDAALVHKKVHDGFKLVPVERQMDHMEDWLSDTRWWILIIQGELKYLEEIREEGKKNGPFGCFPKNTNSCFDFNTACPYLNLCKSRGNPETYEEIPLGYVESIWDPAYELKLESIKEG